jgi:hypothetical protein
MPISDPRAAAVVLGLLLAGCDGGGAPETGEGGGTAATEPAAAGEDGPVDCAIGGGAGWSRDCRVEQAGNMLTIRHADGGFRRFRIVTDGRGVVAADGAEGAVVTVEGEQGIAVTVGQDRYRLPATVGSPRR